MTEAAPVSSEDRIAEVLAGHFCVPREAISVIERRNNPWSSRSPSEILKVRLADRAVCEVLVKYEAENPGHTGHRGGIARESRVYERVLRPLGLGASFYGGSLEAAVGAPWIAIAYIGDAVRISKAPYPGAILSAARWIGHFQLLTRELIGAEGVRFLSRYDLEYYLGWVTRAQDFVGDVGRTYPWFRDACAAAPEVFDILIRAPETIVHGEYYPQNVLWRDGAVFPVDWESAAIGAGEIDLASLVQKWPADAAAAAHPQYLSARDAKGGDPVHWHRLSAAMTYWSFRWLGDSVEWARDPARYDYWFRLLRDALTQVGIPRFA